jgi:hypothetical protein
MPLAMQLTVTKTTADLNACERLLLRCFRQWTIGLMRSDPAALEATWNELASALGPGQARSALDALSSLVFRLAGAARRTILHHHPCCPRLTLDEGRLIDMVAACQHSRRTRAERAAALLAGGGDVEAVLESAEGLAEALLNSGRTLPDRGSASWAGASCFAQQERSTVH